MAIKEDYKSSLKIKLSFKKDVIPRDYSFIRGRLKLPGENLWGFVNSTPLSDYLKNKEGLVISNNNKIHDRLYKGRIASIKTNKRRMTLEASIESQNTLNPNELLNTVNLYDFILTGNYELPVK